MFNNKRRGFFSTLPSMLMIAGLCAISFPSFATFDVMDQDIEGGYYGNGITRPFRNAVEGTEVLTPEDQAYLNSVIRTRITERWYLRILVGHPRVKLVDINNNSTFPLDTFQVATNNVTDNLYQLLIAGGKIYENWAFEGEGFISKRLKLFFNPIFAGIPGSATAEIYTYAFFFNVSYIIPHWVSFYPRRLQIHLDAGLGIALNNTNTTAYDATGAPVESASAYQTPVAGKLAIGARYQITPNILFDIDYIFMSFAKTKFGPVLGFQLQSNELTSSGLWAGFTYQF